jgi:trigger factor
MALDATELRITVEEPAAWARRLRITVPASQIERERRHAAQRLSQRVRLPGFRKGRIPQEVMEKRFGPVIEQETIERLMGEAYRAAVQQEGFQPITEAEIANITYQAGTDLTFDVGFEIRPQIDLARVGGFTVQRPTAEITETEIDQVLERLREQHAVWSPLADEPPAAGDMVTVEITSQEADGSGTTRRYEIVLGEGQAAPAVEDVVRSLRPGEEGDFTVALPEDVNDPTGATKDHPIHVRMTEAKRAERPTLDDALAQTVGDFDGLDTLRARVRQDLEQEAARESERAVRGQLVSRIIEANPFEVPASMVNEYLKRLIPDREDVDAGRLQEVRESTRAAAEFGLRRMLVVDRVAEMESLTATEAEIGERLAAIAERLGRPESEVRAQLRKGGRLAELAHEITENKVFEYLKPLSTID